MLPCRDLNAIQAAERRSRSGSMSRDVVNALDTLVIPCQHRSRLGNCGWETRPQFAVTRSLSHRTLGTPTSSWSSLQEAGPKAAAIGTCKVRVHVSTSSVWRPGMRRVLRWCRKSASHQGWALRENFDNPQSQHPRRPVVSPRVLKLGGVPPRPPAWWCDLQA